MAPPEAFLNLVHAEVHARGGLLVADYLPAAMNAAHRISENESPADAAAMFIRWIFNEPFQGRDASLWLKLTPHLPGNAVMKEPGNPPEYAIPQGEG